MKPAAALGAKKTQQDMALHSFATSQKEFNTYEYINIWGLFLGHLHTVGREAKTDLSCRHKGMFQGCVRAQRNSMCTY